jgi:hypothetical protein
MSECIVRVEGGMRQDGARAAYIRLENSDVIQMLVFDRRYMPRIAERES